MPFTKGKCVVEVLKGRHTRPMLCAGLGALMAGSAMPASAQQGPVELEGIVIEGGTLSGEPADAATLGSATTVITGEELERRQIRHAGDALRTVPGVAVSRSGGVGSQTQVRVRGAEANQLKVIIDGVEVNSLSAGDFQFETLLAEDIERIEVIRGPQSGIYGANALAGVINIVTKKGTREPQVSARVEGGSLGTYGVSANASGAGDFGYLSVSAAKRETDGFNIARRGSEDDGSEQKTIFARAGFSPTDYFRIDVMGRYQENDAETDPDTNFDGLPDDVKGRINLREQSLAGISAELDTLEGQWTHKVYANYFDDDFFDKTDGQTIFINEGSRRKIGYITEVKSSSNWGAPAEHTFVGLTEYVEEDFENQGSFGSVDESRTNAALAGEYRGAFDNRLYITGNWRFDDKDRFEDATTYRLSAAYSWPTSGTRLHGSYGKGITDPTFFEQFGSTSFFIGNPDLKPEESVGWDIGVEQKFLNDRLIIDVTYFQANLEDEILETFDFNTFRSSVINIDGESERKGVEVTARAQLHADLILTGSYTYLDATQPISPFFPNPSGTFREIRRPEHSGSLNVSYTLLQDRAKIDAKVIYNGEEKDGDFGASEIVTLDDYLLVNVAGSYKLDENFELFGRVENLLDEDYEEVFGFSTAPVTAFGGLKVTLGGAPAPLETAAK